MTPEEAAKFIGGNVRIRPHDKMQHFGRAKLLEIRGKKGVIKPWGHPTLVTVDLSDLQAWKAGNPGMFIPAAPPPKQSEQQMQKEHVMAASTPKPAPATGAPVPSMFNPELYVEAMQALKDLADAEQMAKDAAAEVVKARQKWQQLKHQLDEATKA